MWCSYNETVVLEIAGFSAALVSVAFRIAYTAARYVTLLLHYCAAFPLSDCITRSTLSGLSVCLSVPTRIVRNSRMICDGKSSRHEASRCSNSTRAVHALTQGPHVVAVVGPQILCSVVFLQHVRRNEPLCFYYTTWIIYTTFTSAWWLASVLCGNSASFSPDVFSSISCHIDRWCW